MTSYPEYITFKYPKVGEANSGGAYLRLHNLQQRQKVIDLGNEKDIYIPRIKWASDKQLCVYRLNRHQMS